MPAPGRFDFPPGQHLLITTPSRIVAWDAANTHSIFTSSKAGIVASKEAKDGSGILAVADQHTVVLHDTKRGKESSWGLQASDEDRVRHLEYAQGTSTLFLSTNLTSDIQKYSTERSRLLSTAQVHATPPIALAVSPTGHLMVSASDNPPAVYLRNLAHNSPPVLIEPRASESAVNYAAFHPERSNVFLLAFRDGTLAAYDATKILRKSSGSFSNQQSVSDGEIGRLENVHRTTSKLAIQDGTGVKPILITAAAFLPGYKTRSVSVGSDGRCKIVDFVDGGVTVRTWHAKAPLTSVSTLSVTLQNEVPPKTAKRAVNLSSHKIGGPTSTKNLIAVGRADGKVHIYDSLGLLLAEKAVSLNCERIISVEWVKGASPTPLKVKISTVSQPPAQPGAQCAQSVTVVPNIQSPTPMPAENMAAVNFPPTLEETDETILTQQTTASRKFTIHPDEVESDEGTVRYSPSPKRSNKLMPPNIPSSANYLDLFSPIKPPMAKQAEPAQQRIYSPPRIRPRISSQTFIQHPGGRPGLKESVADEPQRVEDSGDQGKTSASTLELHTNNKLLQLKDTKLPPSSIKQRTTYLKPIRKSRRSMGRSEITPNNNARVLADLRKLSSAPTGTQQKQGALSAFAKKSASNSKIHPAYRHHVSILRSPSRQKAWHPGNVLERESTWPTDSLQDEFPHENEDDIWFTSDTDREGKSLRQRRLKTLARPPARQESRTNPENHETGIFPPLASTEDEMLTAVSHFSPSQTQSPTSEDVCELFPRGSSLSPEHRKPHRKDLVALSPGDDRYLREISHNAAQKQKAAPSISPWARVEAEKRTQPNSGIGASNNAPKLEPNVTNNVATVCEGCVTANVTIGKLDEDVARLRGEVLMLKALLRRNGIPIPAALNR
ncbi:Hypothetical protein R9X50_00029400 [Acrodontium crateriforme]|uniref:WD40 repeat-like protein n=1 Tax=Acrodontium crateriforme TaxID=150365 RepID=A0AAQ3M017_9PEZI|nr:Hypothetical protein R9X50_00029400 [Acrodontium crateriforme]